MTYSDQPETVNLAPFLAAVLENAGGEIKVPFDLVTAPRSENTNIAIDFEDEGATIVLRLVELDVDSE